VKHHHYNPPELNDALSATEVYNCMNVRITYDSQTARIWKWWKPTFWYYPNTYLDGHVCNWAL